MKRFDVVLFAIDPSVHLKRPTNHYCSFSHTSSPLGVFCHLSSYVHCSTRGLECGFPTSSRCIVLAVEPNGTATVKRM